MKAEFAELEAEQLNILILGETGMIILSLTTSLDLASLSKNDVHAVKRFYFNFWT